MNKARRYIYALTLILAVLQGMVILASWLWTSITPDTTMRSLLSDSGIRWFFGSFVSNVASPLLVYLVLGCIAVGSIEGSGLWEALRRMCLSGWHSLDAQEIYALRAACGLLLLELVATTLLTLPPHAILLSVTGMLFPSSFSVCLVGIIAFMVASASLAFGIVGGFIRSCEAIGECLCYGGRWIMPLLLFYIVACELFCSLNFILG